MTYTEIELDESILDIDSWLPKEAIDEVVNFIIEQEQLESNESSNN
jgi:hypothetical protein